jgi:hypothetical protein
MVCSGFFSRGGGFITTRRNNPEDTILHSHRRENLKSYLLTFLLLMFVLTFAILIILI